jgi:hypothetical protein
MIIEMPVITIVAANDTICGLNSGMVGEGFVEPKMFVSTMLYE